MFADVFLTSLWNSDCVFRFVLSCEHVNEFNCCLLADLTSVLKVGSGHPLKRFVWTGNLAAVDGSRSYLLLLLLWLR